MAADLYRLTLSYNLSAGAEIASNTLWFLHTAGGALLGDVRARVDANSGLLWTAMKSEHVASVTMRRVRMDLVDISDGHTIAGIDCSIPAGGGTAGGNSPPLQCAPVLSLQTGYSGGSFRGRIYLPPFAAVNLTGTEGRITASSVTQALNAYKTFMNGMRAAGLPLIPGIYSCRLASLTPISQLSMGDVVDTIRQRRSNLVEVKSTVDL